jgi:hypothetical protein
MATREEASDRIRSPAIAEAPRRTSQRGWFPGALAGALAIALAPSVLAKECDRAERPANGRPACADLPLGHPRVACDGLPAGHPPVALMPGLPPGHPPVLITPEHSPAGPATELPPGHPQVNGERRLPPGHPQVDEYPAELPVFEQDTPQTL